MDDEVARVKADYEAKQREKEKKMKKEQDENAEKDKEKDKEESKGKDADKDGDGMPQNATTKSSNKDSKVWHQGLALGGKSGLMFHLAAAGRGCSRASNICTSQVRAK